MALVTYPVGLLYDDSNAVLTAPVVTITSVTTKAGVAVPTPGATVNGSGTSTPISIDYDAETNGEAWITLAVSQSGRTITGANAAPPFYAAKDSSRINTALPNAAMSAQTGDTFARIGTNGAGLTAIGDTRLGYLTGDAYARLGTPAGASVSADVAALGVAIPNSIFGKSLETGATPITFVDFCRIVGAYVAGNDNGSNLFKALGDPTKTRITAAIDSTTKARTITINLTP